MFRNHTIACPPSRAQVRRSYALVWRQALWGIGAALAAFLLGRCPLLFDTRPLGLALLCAATHAIPYLYGGLMLSALTAEQGALVLCCIYTAALLIRLLARTAIELPGAGQAPRPSVAGARIAKKKKRECREDEGEVAVAESITVATRLRLGRERISALLSHWFSEGIYLRMMTACICAFALSLYTLIEGGFLYYDLFGALFAMVTAPTAVFLYAGLFGSAGEGGGTRRREIRRTVAVAALAFSLLYALREMKPLGISAALLLGFGLTLTLTRRRGLLHGLPAALLCGLACSPVLTPSFVLGGLIFGLLQRLSPAVGAISACAVALSWGFYPLGLDALTELLPPFLAAALLFCATDKLIGHPAAAMLTAVLPDPAQVESAERAEIDHQRAESGERRMKEMSETFSSLASLFYSLSDCMRRPGLLDLRRMCDRALDAVCPDCPQRDLCWGVDYAGTLTQLSRMAAALHAKGTVGEDAVEESFRTRCQALPALLTRMNAECARMTETALRTEKTEIFAMDLDGLSQMLSDALEEQKDDFYYDETLSDRVRQALAEMRLEATGVLVWGQRRRRIVARGLDATASGMGAEEIRRRLEEACEASLGELCFDLSDTGVTMRLSSRPRFTVQRVVRTAAATAEPCGDTANIFETEQDYIYALISDGMGSGQEAAFTSGLCSLFLEKMLTAGNRADTSLRMLNHMLRQKGGGISMECSAGIDLLELDLLTGQAVFLKSGASPTYVRRGDALFRLHAQTAPIGILRTVDAQRIAFEAMAGDVIVMISDGIGAEIGTDGTAPEDCPWLLDLLADGWQNDLNIMAETILTKARKEGSRDDLSVILIEITEA